MADEQKPRRSTKKTANAAKKTVKRAAKPEKASFRKGSIGESKTSASKEQVLYVDLDEEIPSIIDRVKRSRASQLLLVVPKRATFLESQVNVKLLAKEAAAAGKAVTLVSKEKKAQHLAAQAGIPIIDEIAGQGAPVVSAPSRRVEGSEHRAREGQATLKGLLAGRAKPANTPRDLRSRQTLGEPALMAPSSNRRLLLFFLGLCAVVLLLVSYFVLPKATIAVEMESRVVTMVDRIILADREQNSAALDVPGSKYVPTKPVSIEKELTKTYKATGIISSGTNAQGLITIVNDAGTSQPLIAQTRFRTNDGIIFRIQSAVTVPAKGRLGALAVADSTDEAGRIVGDRGNIPANTRFTIPGLRGANAGVVYGVANAAFTGGVTKANRTVSQADIDGAKKDIVESMQKSATEDLRAQLEDEARRGPFYQLVGDPALVSVETISLDTPGVTPGALREDFNVLAKIAVRGIAYNRDDLVQILDQKVKEVIHPDQRLATRDIGGMSIDIVSPRDAREERAGRIRVNAQMKTRFEYVMSPELEGEIRKRILGKSVDDAEQYVQGLQQVGETRVTTWPFWVRNIPGIASSIRIQPVDEIGGTN